MQNDKIVYLKNKQLDKATQEKKIYCICYSPSERSCKAVETGIFLPTTDYIISYCETSFYTSCNYFQKYSHEQGVPADEFTNRRQAQRRVFRRKIRFSGLTDSCLGESEGNGVDISSNGVCFETDEELVPGMKIYCEIGNNPVKFMGEVIWFSPSSDHRSNRCGASFS